MMEYAVKTVDGWLSFDSVDAMRTTLAKLESASVVQLQWWTWFGRVDVKQTGYAWTLNGYGNRSNCYRTDETPLSVFDKAIASYN